MAKPVAFAFGANRLLVLYLAILGQHRGSSQSTPANVSMCPCDLTGNSCNVNCCCDPDCSDADKQVFSECSRNQYTLDNKLCFDKDVFFSENGPSRSGDSGNLFCIYFDNDEDRNYYNNPSLITTEEEFARFAAKTKTFSFQSHPDPLDLAGSSFEPFYKSGDPIYTVFPNGYFSYLGLPSSVAADNFCVDSSPTAFFIDKTNICDRLLDDLSECDKAHVLKASTFFQNFRIVKDPFLLQAFNSTTTKVSSALGAYDLTDVTDLYNNSYTIAVELEPENPLLCIVNGVTGPCAFSVIPANPTYADETCKNALVGVHYRFETNGVFGIDKAYVRLTFADLTSQVLQQTYSASFTAVTKPQSGEQFQRSGNPGYDVGQPIIAGVFNITQEGSSSVEEVLLIEDRGQQLALVKPSASGDCITAAGLPREPVLFGEDMRTGCLLTISPSDNCVLLQQEIIKAVEGYAVPTYDTARSEYPKNNRYVAMFGNSDVRQTGDWVEVFFKGRPGNDVFQGPNCRLSLGAEVQVLYANVGSLANPQAKIIGVSYVYEAQQVIQYQCTAASCQPGQPNITQRVEVSTSVTFIDVSDPAVGVEGQYPTVPARLPYDFFYPFTDASPHRGSLSRSLWALSVLVVLRALLW